MTCVSSPDVVCYAHPVVSAHSGTIGACVVMLALVLLVLVPLVSLRGMS